MMDFGKKRLGDMLIQMGSITEKQLQEALKKQKSHGKKLGEILIEDEIITEDDILSLLEVQLSIPRVYVEMLDFEPEAVNSITVNLAKKHMLIPISFHENKIKVVMSDPLDLFAYDDLKIATGHEIEPFIASKKEIKKAIDKYYSSEYAKKAEDELVQEKKIINAEKLDSEKVNFDDIKNAPAVRLVDSIISNSVKLRTSDIHIEPFEKHIKVRYRIDGQLKEVLRLNIETHPSLVTRIKILADLNIAEKRLPQDGRIVTVIDGKEIDLRVSTIPTVFGEKIVIRVLNKDSSLIGKQSLSLDKDELKKIENMLNSPHGIILVTGPTGSGKSTTLYSMLKELNSENKNIVTIEDPVEYLFEGINQINVNNKAGLTFATGLRSILRQDPDIVMIGEIRDNETAEIAIKAAITGHLVLSTLHTNDAPSSVVRLIDMGIEPYLVATSVSGVISQRLVRKICPKCEFQYKANEYEKRILGLSENEDITLKKGEGCAYCGGTGYLGRTGIYEIMEVSRTHREYIMNRKSGDELSDLSIHNGMNTLETSCIRLVLNGQTTIDELVKIAFLKE